MAIKVVKVGILLVWLVSIGWLLRFEAFPDWFVHSISGYKSLIRSKPALVDSWMKVDMNGTHIGYSHTEVELDENEGTDEYNVRNLTMLKLLMMGEGQRVKMTSDVVLDGSYGMKKFFFAMSSRNYNLRLEGKRIGDEEYDVELKSSGSSRQMQVRIPSDAVIYSPYLEMVLKELAPGASTRLKVFDPMSMATSVAVIRAIENESIVIKNEAIESTRLGIEFNGMKIEAWMDEDGQIVRQKTPFGWTMEACTPDVALSYDEDSFGSVDLIASAGIRVAGDIGARDDKEVRYLRLKGVGFNSEELVTYRQEVLAHGEDWIDVKLHSPSWPPPGDGYDGESENMAPFLKATTYIQSDHPDLIKRAKAITDGLTDEVSKAKAIYEWVNHTVQKMPTVSLPSALDVLKNMQGDCNEHTYLFVGLARSVGLPAKVRVGIMYVDEFFGYHAWPAVHVNGRWHDLDPTLGQTVVDSTHVSLLEGELENQMMLMQYLGQLTIEVLPEPETDD